MKKLLMAVGIVGVGIALVFVLAPQEPQYEGRSITQWLDDWAAKKVPNRSLEALRRIGTNALPYAVNNLARNDSNWRSNYAKVQAKMPAWLQKHVTRPKPLLQEVDGANVFSHLGSNSLPHAIALLKHASPTVRRSAAGGVFSLRRQTPEARRAIPALIDALADPDRMVRFQAALALKEMGADASNAVPALMRILDNKVAPGTNNDFYVRAAAASALGKIGPGAASALPVLKAALTETHSYFRGQVATAILRISGDVDTALPVLLTEMPVTMGDSKWEWIIALGEMGPRAKAAVPQLKKELHRNQKKWVLTYVTNALKNIDPEAAAEAGVK
jgi:hypothetical protein